ncbi:MAG: aldehyde dehydrogenase family protein, partial [Methylocystis sp.]|nr:aldehyde dehydrogenase family protein [Methylocystis sp.]
MIELTHFIGGRRVKGASGRFAEGFEPMTGEAISRVPLAAKAEVRAAVENAAAAQPAWVAAGPQRRARVLTKFIDLVARDMGPLAELLAREHGKTIADARG